MPPGSCNDPLGVRFDFAAGRWDGDATRCRALDEDLPTVCAFADDRAFMEFLGHLLRCVVLAETLDRLDAEEFDR